MARQLKPQVVGEFEHMKTRKKYEIMLDRNNLKFFVEIDDQKIYEASADEAKRAATKILNEKKELEWRRIIRVHLAEDSRFGWSTSRRPIESLAKDPLVGLAFGRFEIADTEVTYTDSYDGQRKQRSKTLMREFYTDKELRAMEEEPEIDDKEASRLPGIDHPAYRRWRRRTGLDVSDFRDHTGNSQHVVEIPYSEESWNALKLIQDRIILLNQQLRSLLGQDTIIESLQLVAATNGRMLLGPGSEE